MLGSQLGDCRLLHRSRSSQFLQRLSGVKRRNHVRDATTNNLSMYPFADACISQRRNALTGLDPESEVSLFLLAGNYRCRTDP